MLAVAAVSCIFFLPLPTSPSATVVLASGRGRGENRFISGAILHHKIATSANADRKASVKIASAKNTKSATATPKQFCIHTCFRPRLKSRTAYGLHSLHLGTPVPSSHEASTCLELVSSAEVKQNHYSEIISTRDCKVRPWIGV